MTKVEELREVIEALNEQCEKDLPYQTGLMLDVDTLIAAARAEGAERVKADLETWLLREDNEYVATTFHTSTYLAKRINVEAVVDFLHDRLTVLAPKGEGK